METLTFFREQNQKNLKVRKTKAPGASSPARTVARILGGLALLYVLQGCMPCYYAPSSQNVPLFTEKNEFNGSAGLKLGAYSQGFDMQLAYAPTDHLGLTAGYSGFRAKQSAFALDEDYSDRFRSNAFDLGMGYYTKFSKYGVFETYAGYGTGSLSNDYSGSGSSRLGHSSFFLQPALGLHTKHVQIAFSLRYRLVNYTKVKVGYSGNEYDTKFLFNLKNDPLVSFLEPAFTGRFGGKSVKFQVQVCYSFLLKEGPTMSYDPFHLNLGLVFTVGGKKKL